MLGVKSTCTLINISVISKFSSVLHLVSKVSGRLVLVAFGFEYGFHTTSKAGIINKQIATLANSAFVTYLRYFPSCIATAISLQTSTGYKIYRLAS